MFPDSHHLPARIVETSIGVGVATLIREDLLSPPRCVGLRPCRMIRTAMPETAVDEHSDPRPPEDNIRAAPNSGDRRVIDPVPKSTAMEELPESQFGRSVTLPCRFHPLPRSRRRRGRG